MVSDPLRGSGNGVVRWRLDRIGEAGGRQELVGRRKRLPHKRGRGRCELAGDGGEHSDDAQWGTDGRYGDAGHGLFDIEQRGDLPPECGGGMEGRGQQQGALEEFDEALADDGGFFGGVAGIGPELVFSVRQAVGFELDLTAFRVSAHEDEIAVVGDQDLVVAVPVFGDLRAIGGAPGIVGSGLDFDYAARRDAGSGGFGLPLGN